MSHAIIIGGGISGLATAVWLAKDGWQITLLERKPVLGGRAYTFRDAKSGAAVDNGQHLLMGCYTHTLDFLAEIGSLDRLEKQPRLSVPLRTETGEAWAFSFPNWPAPFHLLGGLITASALPRADRWRLLALGVRLARYKKRGIPEAYKHLSVRQWLTEIGQSHLAQIRFWDILTYATLNESPDLAHAYGLITVLIQGIFGSKEASALLFPPRAGLSALYVEPALAYLRARGAQVITGAHIREFVVSSVESSTPVILQTETHGEITGDLLVSAVSASAYRRLLEKSTLPMDGDVPQDSSPILSVNLWMDRPILGGSAFIGVSERNIHWWFERPESGQSHLIGVASGARHLLDATKQEIVDLALCELGELFPLSRNARLLHSLVNKEREATFSLTPDNESRRPPQWTSSPHFYRVGDWTDTGLPATLESAVVSARKCVERIKEQRAFYL